MENCKIISLEGAWAGGKTTILKHLECLNYQTYGSIVPEIYKSKGYNYSPRNEAKDFTTLFAKVKEEQFNAATKRENDLVFFDRAFFAPIVLRKFLGMEIPDAFYDVAQNENLYKTVFLVEPIPLAFHPKGWPRKHFTYEESLLYHKITEDVIKSLGFDVHKVKYSSNIEDRVKDILSKIDTLENSKLSHQL